MTTLGFIRDLERVRKRVILVAAKISEDKYGVGYKSMTWEGFDEKSFLGKLKIYMRRREELAGLFISINFYLDLIQQDLEVTNNNDELVK